MNPILLLERRAGFAHALQILLRDAGYETVDVASVEQATCTAAETAFALLIVGEVDGGLLRTTHRLKQHPATCSLPLLLHTPDWSVYNEAFVRASGADGILPDPLARQPFLQQIACYTSGVPAPRLGQTERGNRAKFI